MTPPTSSFDAFYGEMRGGLYYPKPSGILVQLVKQQKLKGGCAIDLGCGDGRNTFFLAEFNFSVTAVDISTAAISKIKQILLEQNIDNVECLVADVCDLDFNSCIYDLIVMSTILDHLTREQIYSLVDKVKKWLAPGGYLYASVFTVDDPGFALQHMGNASTSLRMHGIISPTAEFVRTYFQYEELRSLFQEFTILSYRETFEKDLSHGTPHYHGIARITCQKI